MIEILVTRGAGDRQGPDISDPLITSVPVALAKGAAEINRSCSDRKTLSLETVLLPFFLPGCLARITTYKGRRTGKLRSMEKEYSLTGQEFTATCRMDIEVAGE